MTLFAGLPPVRDARIGVTLPPLYVAASWLHMSIGEEKTADALQLPESLIVALYHDILAYGPAAVQVAEIYDRQQEIETSEEGASWQSKVEKLGQFMVMDSAGERNLAAKEAIVNWSQQSKLTVMEQRFILLSNRGSGAPLRQNSFERRHRYMTGLNSIYWFVTGQYLFPKQLVSECSHLVVRVNVILDALGLEPLTGTFTSLTRQQVKA